jgi:hypothetical protein
MDEICWNMFNTIMQLMQQFARFRYQPPVQPQIVNTFPDGIMDFYFTPENVHWPGLDLQHPRLFEHQGIVYANYVEVPSLHFFLEGSMEALHHCLLRVMLLDLMNRLCVVFNRMCLRGDAIIAPYPAHHAPSLVDLSRTIRLPTQPVDSSTNPPLQPPVVAAPIPHFHTENGSLVQLQNFVSAFNISTEDTSADVPEQSILQPPPGLLPPQTTAPHTTSAVITITPVTATSTPVTTQSQEHRRPLTYSDIATAITRPLSTGSTEQRHRRGRSNAPRVLRRRFGSYSLKYKFFFYD